MDIEIKTIQMFIMHISLNSNAAHILYLVQLFDISGYKIVSFLLLEVQHITIQNILPQEASHNYAHNLALIGFKFCF